MLEKGTKTKGHVTQQRFSAKQRFFGGKSACRFHANGVLVGQGANGPFLKRAPEFKVHVMEGF